MKMIRSISGAALIKLLSKLGYEKTGQRGSHIKITTIIQGQHHLVIPNHDPLKIGTLNAILRQVAGHFEKSKEEIVDMLF